MTEQTVNDIDVDLVEETAGTEPANSSPAVDLVEGEEGEPPPKLPAGAKLAEGDDARAGKAVIYELAFPVKLSIRNGAGVVREEQITHLPMYRATAPDMDVLFNTKTDGMRALMCRMTRISPTRITKIYEKLDGSDIMALSQITDFLLANGRKTGR